ncbi:MAG: hypothetical protein MAG451_01888 [Anaerolineales bacterium]|nr:hypothetical protein [Anaerolineales bacterium]
MPTKRPTVTSTATPRTSSATVGRVSRSVSQVLEALLRSVLGVRPSGSAPVLSQSTTRAATLTPTRTPTSSLTRFLPYHRSRLWERYAVPTVRVSSSAVIIATEDDYPAFNLRSGPSARCSVVGGVQVGTRVIVHGGWAPIRSERYPAGWTWVLVETEAARRAWVWGAGVRLTEHHVTLPTVSERDIPACALSSQPAVEPTTPTPDEVDPQPDTSRPVATPTSTRQPHPSVTPAPSPVRPIPRPPTPTPAGR